MQESEENNSWNIYAPVNILKDNMWSVNVDMLKNISGIDVSY